MIIPQETLIRHFSEKTLNKTYFEARNLIQIVYEALLYFVDDDQDYSLGGFLQKSPQLIAPYKDAQFQTYWIEVNGTKHEIVRDYAELIHPKNGLLLKSKDLKMHTTEVILDSLQKGTLDDLQAWDQAMKLTNPGQIYSTEEIPPEFLPVQELMTISFAKMVRNAVEELQKISGTLEGDRIYFEIHSSPEAVLKMNLERRTQRLQVKKQRNKIIIKKLLLFFSKKRKK